MCVCLSLSVSEKSLFYAFTRARVTNVFKVFRLKILQKTRGRRERGLRRQRRDKEDKALIEAPTENEDDDDELREKEDRKANDR